MGRINLVLVIIIMAFTACNYRENPENAEMDTLCLKLECPDSVLFYETYLSTINLKNTDSVYIIAYSKNSAFHKIVYRRNYFIDKIYCIRDKQWAFTMDSISGKFDYSFCFVDTITNDSSKYFLSDLKIERAIFYDYCDCRPVEWKVNGNPGQTSNISFDK
jgi:hypothetical protein